MATARLLPRPPRRRVDHDGRHHGPRRGRRPSRRARGRHRRASTARCPTTWRRRDARRAPPGRDRALGRRSSASPASSGSATSDSGMRAGRRTTTPARSSRPTSTRPPSGWPRSCATRAPTSLTIYDWHGNYGHPDHIRVHRVGHRAAELAGTPHVYEATMNRDAVRRMIDGPAGVGGLRPRRRLRRAEHRRRQPARHARGRAHDGGRRHRLHRRRSATSIEAHPARSPTRRSSSRCRPRSSPSPSARSGSSTRARRPASTRHWLAGLDTCAGRMPRLILVRHGRAAHGLGGAAIPVSTTSAGPRPQALADALAPRCRLDPIVTSPLARCRQTAAPLAARWGIEPRGRAGRGRAARRRRASPPPTARRGCATSIGGDLDRARAAVPRVPSHRRARRRWRPSRSTRSCSATSSPSTRRSGLRSATTAWSSCTSTTPAARSLDVDGGRFTLVEGGHEADTLIR